MHQQLLGRRGYVGARPRSSASASLQIAALSSRPFVLGCQGIPHSAHHLRQSVATQSAPVAAPSTEAPQSPVSDSGDSPRQSSAYPFIDIEGKWQAYWLSHKTFRTPEEIDTSKPKYYVLDMFPYPRRAAPHEHAYHNSIGAPPPCRPPCMH